MDSVQNLPVVPFCCVLEKDTLSSLSRVGGLDKQFVSSVIFLYQSTRKTLKQKNSTGQKYLGIFGNRSRYLLTVALCIALLTLSCESDRQI